MRSSYAGSSVVVAMHGSDCGCTIAVLGKGAAGGVSSGTGMGAGSGVPSVAGSPMGGPEVAAICSPSGLGLAPSRELSGSSIVSTDCRLIACLSASFC